MPQPGRRGALAAPALVVAHSGLPPPLGGRTGAEGQALQGKEDQDAVDGFLSLWSEVLRKVPSPSAEQTADWYKPGNYVAPKKPPE